MEQSNLSADTKELIHKAENIEDSGIKSSFDKEFEEMETALDKARRQLDSANVTKETVDELRKQIDDLEKQIKEAKENLDKVAFFAHFREGTFA